MRLQFVNHAIDGLADFHLVGVAKAAVSGPRGKQFIEIVRNSTTDGEVCDWVRQNVKQPESVKAAHRERMLNYPKKDDAEMQARLKLRKEQAGLAQRDDIQCFVDFIDADEKRI